MQINNTISPVALDENLNTLLSQLTFYEIFSEASDLARIGHYAEAENLLKTIFEWDRSVSVLDLLARIYAQQGKFNLASNYWELALDHSPLNLDYQKSYKFVSKSQQPVTGFTKFLKTAILIVFGILIFSSFALLFKTLSANLEVNHSSPTESIYQTTDQSLDEKVTERLDLLLENQEKIDRKISSLQISTSVPNPTHPVDQISVVFPGANVIHVNQYVTLVYFDDITFDYGWHFISPAASNTLTSFGKHLESESGRIQIAIIGLKSRNEADDYFDLGLMRSVRVFDHLGATTNLPPNIFVIQPMQTFLSSPYAAEIKDLGKIDRSVIFIIELIDK